MNFKERKGLAQEDRRENPTDGLTTAAEPNFVASESRDPFVEYLKTLGGKKIYLKPYWGNSGDELILMGIRLIMRQLGLELVVNPKIADVILWPGGNPTMWPVNLAGWRDCWQQWPAAEFVVGPAGFQGHALPWRDLLKQSPAKIGGLFARDSVSHENLRSLNLPASVTIGLAHDPALYLRNSQWVADHREACTNEYVLAAFRTDLESALRRKQPSHRLQRWPVGTAYEFYNRRQTSRHYGARYETVRRIVGKDATILRHDASQMSFNSFVECISRASEVHTDRLHCMILALLFGKPVFAYPTSYSKLEDIYHHSIKSWAAVTLVPDQYAPGH